MPKDIVHKYNLETGMTTLEVEHDGQRYESVPLQGEISNDMARHIRDFHFDLFKPVQDEKDNDENNG